MSAVLRRLVTLVPRQGLLILGTDSAGVVGMEVGAPCRVTTFGLGETAEWRATSLEPVWDGTTFTVEHHGTPVTDLRVPLLGEFNVRNVLAAFVVASEVGLDATTLAASVARFKGVQRRLEVRGRERGVTVYDDFAHHPTAVRETLAGVRASNPSRRLWALFEPRSATACRRIFQDDFAEAFRQADEVIIGRRRRFCRRPLGWTWQLSQPRLGWSLALLGVPTSTRRATLKSGGWRAPDRLRRRAYLGQHPLKRWVWGQTESSIRVQEGEAPANLDLYVRPEIRIDSFDAEDVLSEESGRFNDVLVVDYASEIPLQAGEWHITVAYQLLEPPLVDGGALERIPFTLRADLIRTRVDAALRPPMSQAGVVTPETGSFRTFTVEVPREAQSLRIDLSDVWSDLDLIVRRNASILDPYDADHRATTFLAQESLVIDRFSDPPLQPGLYHINVWDQQGGDEIPFRIHVRFDREPPTELLEIPAIPTPIGAIDRAVLATVELNWAEGGGSGTLLTSDGLLLTNHHVIESVAGGVVPDGDLVIGVTLDARFPPRELFRGRVVVSDQELDLALVEIDRGLYDRPLPQDYRFVFLELGDSEALRIGSPLSIVGYPSVGGQGFKVGINYTRGVISGFDPRSIGSIIKTDADIGGGNSGGAALDEHFRLVGVPTGTVDETLAGGTASVGYVYPVSMIPAEWLDRIARRRRR